jgi:tripartite-type tricarboxylate transporter receptor subunit TctC
MNRRILLIAAAMLGMGLGTPVAAQSFPDKPITIVVPFAPGASDTAARIVAEHMTKTLGQRVLVDNRPGASGAIGTEFVKRAAPDGYTLLFGAASQMTINPIVKKLNYDPRTDFTNVGLLGVAPYVLAVNASIPAKNLKELVTWGKAQPTPLKMGNAGIGSLSDIAALLFAHHTGVKVLSVPYKGTHPAAIALEAGEAPAMVATYVSFPGGIQSGKVKILAVAADKRLPNVPDIPTFAEAGLPNFEVGQWWGFYGPQGIPAPILKKLNDAVNAALADAGVRKKFEDIGAIPVSGSPEDHKAFLLKEYKRWEEIIRSTGVVKSPA